MPSFLSFFELPALALCIIISYTIPKNDKYCDLPSTFFHLVCFSYWCVRCILFPNWWSWCWQQLGLQQNCLCQWGRYIMLFSRRHVHGKRCMLPGLEWGNVSSVLYRSWLGSLWLCPGCHKRSVEVSASRCEWGEVRSLICSGRAFQHQPRGLDTPMRY